MMDMNQPLISVVIPAYRCADTVRTAIDSALAQDVSLEVLVLDDCPSEPIGSVMEAYRGDSRVRYIQNQQNLGAAQCRNKGIALAKGKYIAFLDADDWWLPGKLRKQLTALERSGCVLCATARELVKADGKTTGKVFPVQQRITYRQLLQHNSICCSSVLMRADVAREFPMHHADSHEDYIMWLEILRKYGTACGVNEPLVKYRLSSTGKSGSKLHSAKMTWMVYRYMGFGPLKSAICFCSYAANGLWKYFLKK